MSKIEDDKIESSTDKKNNGKLDTKTNLKDGEKNHQVNKDVAENQVNDNIEPQQNQLTPNQNVTKEEGKSEKNKESEKKEVSLVRQIEQSDLNNQNDNSEYKDQLKTDRDDEKQEQPSENLIQNPIPEKKSGDSQKDIYIQTRKKSKRTKSTSEVLTSIFEDASKKNEIDESIIKNKFSIMDEKRDNISSNQ